MSYRFIIGIVCLFVSACSLENSEKQTISAMDQLRMEDFSMPEYAVLNYNGSAVKLNEASSNYQEFLIPEIEEQRGDITFRAKKIPVDLYLLNQGVEQSELDSIMGTLEGEQLFYVEFEEDQQQDLLKKYFKGNMDAPVQYMTAQIARDFSIQTPTGKIITTSNCLYERNFHTAPFERLLISFTGLDTEQEMKLVYNDKLFGRGAMTFSFPANSYIKNINVPS